MAALTVAGALALAFGLTRVAEFGAGWYLAATHRNAGLIWGPDSHVEHATGEFSYRVQVNNLGFRDRDFSVHPQRGVRRVVALGDSFTYGWGVDANESWPKVLERELERVGIVTEIANLGAPGAGPRQYADLAERAIPLLKPELVVVGVLQADDLWQAAEASTEHHRARPRGAVQAFRAYYPNLMQLASPEGAARLEVTQDQLQATWKKQVSDFLTHTTPEERVRYEALSNDVREAYLAGVLNPGLLYMALRHNRFLIDTCDWGRKTRTGIAAMGSEFARISAVAKRAQARVLVVPIPYRAYVSLADSAQMRKLGFAVEDQMVGWTAPDEAIGAACRAAGIEMATVTPAFRERAQAQSLYFPMDGHLNAKGQAAFAELAAAVVRVRLNNP